MMKVMGYDVYDCDSRARGLMTGDEDVRRQLISTFGKDIYLADGNINREHLSTVAFADKSALNRLNAIVHPAVQNDLLLYSANENNGWIFVESAILYESGLNQLCNYVVAVIAPKKLRIERTMTRDGKTREQVMARINTQMSNCSLRKKANYIVENNEKQSLTQLTDKLIKHLHKAIGSL